MKVLPLALGLTLLAACAPSSGSPDNATANDESLTSQDFDQTVKDLTALPYLPWGFTPDGCYARALYYSMELATKDIPSNHLYVIAKSGTALFGQWSWHVAPVVTKDGDPDHLYVLDPAFNTTKALTNLEWVALQGYPDPEAAKYPSLHVWPGNSYLKTMSAVNPLENPASPVAADYKEPTPFAAMPSFAMVDIRSACETMHDYIDIEPGKTAAEKRQKHKDLGAASKSIVTKLVAKQKISGNPSMLTASCTRENGESGTRTDLPAADPSRTR